jgi:hypothetical protein
MLAGIQTDQTLAPGPGEDKMLPTYPAIQLSGSLLVLYVRETNVCSTDTYTPLCAAALCAIAAGWKHPDVFPVVSG